MRIKTSFLAASLAFLASASGVVDAEAAKKSKPTVEVVFCVDTTGSMSGLINAAKQKIWTISNQIASGTPTPRLKIGLIAYRDRGDAYVTKRFDLTEDLDAIHGHLMKLRAQGGKDFPESVNQALREAVTKMSWTKNKKTLKIVFLVGDAPPHFYKDDTPFEDTCKDAVKNNIIINAVQCGNNAKTRKAWESICHLAEGSYVQIGASGGPVVTVRTPFDKDLAKINSELARSTLGYGTRMRRMEAKTKARAAESLPAAAAADRAGFAAKDGRAAAYDLLDAIKSGKVKLNDVKEAELPDELRKLDKKQRNGYLKELDERRQKLLRRAAQLDKKRAAFIAKEVAQQAKKGDRKSFDGQVLNLLQKQAKRLNIRYGAEDAADERKKK